MIYLTEYKVTFEIGINGPHMTVRRQYMGAVSAYQGSIKEVTELKNKLSRVVSLVSIVEM